MPLPLVAAAGAVAATGGAAAGGAAVAGTAATVGGAAAGGAAAAGTAATVGGAAAGGAAAAGTAATVGGAATGTAATVGSEAASKVASEAVKSQIKDKIKEEFEKKLKDELKDRIINGSKKVEVSDDSKEKRNKNDDNYKAPKQRDGLGPKDDNNQDKDKDKNKPNPNAKGANDKNLGEQLKDQAKDQAKELAKDGAAKVGGKALSVVSKGVIPPKVGEKISKKALDAGEKLVKKHGLDPLKRNNPLKNISNKLKDNFEKNKARSKKAIDKTKKAVKTYIRLKKLKRALPFIAAGLACFMLVVALSVGVSLIQSYMPGVFGDIKKEDVKEDYSNRDQKILDKIARITNKYPNAKAADSEDGTSAGASVMATVAYPYYDLLQSDDVKNRASKEEKKTDDDGNEETIDSEEYKDALDSNGSFEGDSEDENDKDSDEETETENDMYLNLFSKKKYRKKYEELLKVYDEKGEEGYKKYLKTEYINDDKGYKNLLKNVSTEEKDEAIDDIVNDAYSNSNYFEAYIPEVTCTSSSNLTSLGSGNASDVAKGEIQVTLRDYFATNGTFKVDDFYKAPVLYNTDSSPLSFGRYIMGVAYSEHAGCARVESCAKAIMITAKSYSIGRQGAMNYKTEYLDGKTILHMRGNVGDQDFCDVYEGCESGTYSKGTWSNFTGEGYNNRKPAMSKEEIANLEKWWNEIADQYLTTSDGKFTGPQYNDYNNNCKQGSCLSQTKIYSASKDETDYMNILFNSDNGGFDNSKYALYKSDEDVTYAASVSSDTDCPTTNCGVSGSRDEIVTFAKSMVGKIVYYFGGKPAGPNYEDNNFGSKVAPDITQGRTTRGLDCSGFVDFVFWHVTGENFGLSDTSGIRDKYSDKIAYEELKPGDIGFLDMTGSGTRQHVGIYIGKDSNGNDLWVDCNASHGVQEHNTTEFKVFFRPKVLNETDETTTNTCPEDGSGIRVCKTFNLSDSDIETLASVSYREQGSVDGARAEASLMANKYELDGKTGNLKDYVMNSKWWASASKTGGKAPKDVVNAVKDVLVGGHRSFPSYVNEHDCISCGSYGFDITKLTLDGKTYTSSKDLLDHKNYVQDKTVIYNKYGSKYTFYSFPTENSDPFGYTKKTTDTCKLTGGANTDNTNGLFSDNNRKDGQHAGQCVIYAEDRAKEIIKSAKVGYTNISDKSKYLNVWNGGFGYAKCALQDCGNGKAAKIKSLFKTSDDYTKPQAGSAVVWGPTSSSKAGHIGIIEKVNSDGSVLVSQSNWCKGNCEKFNFNKLTPSQLKSYGDHKFIGYIYLLQPK